MNAAERNQLTEARNNGWKFTHLMGSKMSATDGTVTYIVYATTSVRGYRELLKKINNK